MNNDIVKNEFIEIEEIPNGWKMVKLSELGEGNDSVVAGPFGSNLKVSDYRDEGVPIIRLQNIERNRFLDKDIKYISEEKAKELQYHSFKAGDLLLAKLGDPIGKTCLVPQNMRNGIVVSDVVRIRVSSEKAVTPFIEFALNSNYCTRQLNKQTIGTTRPRVNLTDVRELIIALPALAEQRKIASTLHKVNSLIQITDQIIYQIDTLRIGLMEQLLIRGIGHREYKSVRLGLRFLNLEIPIDWDVMTLKSLVYDVKGGAPLKPNDFADRGFPVLHKGDIKENDTLKISEINPYCKSDFAKKYESSIIESSYLVVTLRDLIPSGPAIGLIAHSNGTYLLAQGIYAFHINKSQIDSKYLVYLSNTRYYRRYMRGIAVGSTQIHIRTSEFLKIKLLLPPINEQQKIASILQTVEKWIKSEHSYRSYLLILRDGLMQKLLTGKIRVKV